MKITIPYSPRLEQAQIHSLLKRFNVLVCHRRFGKTVLSINELLRDCLAKDPTEFPMPRYAYIAPIYKQAKRVAWDYLKEYTKNIPKKFKKINETNLTIDFKHNNSRISLYGADNPDALRGIYLDGAVLDEIAYMRPSVWSKIIRPTLSDREGWALFIGTPNGRNMFYDLYMDARLDDFKDWTGLMYTVDKTNIIKPTELEDLRKTMPPDEFAQEYMCSFDAALAGAYYGNIINDLEERGQVCHVPYRAELPVHTAWDLGIDDATAIWFYQKERGGRINFIDYHEDSDEGLRWYAQVLHDKGYLYGDHWAPHDIEHREVGTGQTRLRTARNFGINFKVVQKVPNSDGINAARMLLPRCWFDLEKVGPGLEALRCFRKEYNERLGVYKQKELHDWSSHAADAFRYFATSYRDGTSDMLPKVGPMNAFYDQGDGLPPLPNKERIRHNRVIQGPYTPPHLLKGRY